MPTSATSGNLKSLVDPLLPPRPDDVSTPTLNFPVIRGVQAGREYFVAMWTLRMLRQMSIFNESELPAEMRAQRVLNKARIPEICGYILDNPKDYVFSALTVSIDSRVIFEPLTPQEARLGTLKVPMEAKFNQ